MAVDHMLFDLKKYYPSNYVPLLGKEIVKPKTEVMTYEEADNFSNTHDGVIPKGAIVGVVQKGSDFFITDGYKVSGPSIGSGRRWFSLNSLIQNGGVSNNPLAHVCRAVSHLERRLAWQ